MKSKMVDLVCLHHVVVAIKDIKVDTFNTKHTEY